MWNKTNRDRSFYRFVKSEQIDFSYNYLNDNSNQQAFNDTKSIERVDLSENLLSKFPPLDFPTLYYLELDHNKIYDLQFIQGLANVKELSVSDNKIKELSSEISALKNLERLILNSNSIRVISDSINKLSNLKVLSIDDNRLKELPKGFSELKKLETITLSGNLFTLFPEELLKMPWLKNIDFRDNSILLTEEEKGNIRKRLPGTKIDF